MPALANHHCPYDQHTAAIAAMICGRDRDYGAGMKLLLNRSMSTCNQISILRCLFTTEASSLLSRWSSRSFFSRALTSSISPRMMSKAPGRRPPTISTSSRLFCASSSDKAASRRISMSLHLPRRPSGNPEFGAAARNKSSNARIPSALTLVTALVKSSKYWSVFMPTWHSRRIASPRDLIRFLNIQSSIASSSEGDIIVTTRWSFSSLSSSAMF